MLASYSYRRLENFASARLRETLSCSTVIEVEALPGCICVDLAILQGQCIADQIQDGSDSNTSDHRNCARQFSTYLSASSLTPANPQIPTHLSTLIDARDLAASGPTTILSPYDIRCFFAFAFLYSVKVN